MFPICSIRMGTLVLQFHFCHQGNSIECACLKLTLNRQLAMQCCPITLIYIKTNLFLHFMRNMSIISAFIMQDLNIFCPWKLIKNIYEINHRSSRPDAFCKKGILRNLAKFTEKHLCQSLFSIKLQACNFIKKKTLAQVFSSEFFKISQNTFSYRTHPVAAS